ncbi:hypothetical protein CHH28_03225 [Bacterioplanes sanyensis]|uniref:Diguanylate cyclase n=1 Tax=Bacterioplanes sanyensis TaxID=1249553 RepID=A0A222FF85_9GAMM|nr:EAL domain-containing protein [Bacterioplanes sanyensis]ASP37745.1 hypothetical protein CHH28_03225 [Bacterioplanes sanyensis]
MQIKAIILAATLWLLTAPAKVQAEPAQVLLLLSYDPMFPTSHLIVDTVRHTLESESQQPLQLHVEFLYSKHNNNAEYLAKALELLKMRRPLAHYDLIITADDNALRLVHYHARPHLNNTPVVFLGVNDANLIRLVRGNGGYTGQFEGLPGAEFMAWYRTFFAEQTLRVIADGRPTSLADLEQIKAASRGVGQPINILSLTKLSWSELAQQLDANTDPVLLLSSYRDRLGENKTFPGALRFISHTTAAPLLHVYRHGIGRGIIGGIVVDHRQHVRLAARQALQVLAGQRINDIDVNWSTPAVPLADKALFAQYGLSAQLMPEDTLWLNDEPSAWLQLHQLLLFAAAAMLLFIAPLFWLWLKWQQSRLRDQQHRRQLQSLQQALDAVPDIVFIKDSAGHYRFCNAATAQFLGQTAEQLEGVNDRELFTAEQTAEIQHVDRSVIDGQQRRTLDEWIQDSSSRLALLQTTKTPLLDESGAVAGLIGVARDITELRKTQQSLEHMAHHDGLTGLPNRTLLYQRLTYALQMAQRNSEQIAVVYVDLDRFKDINDTLGHAIGDLLLRDVAQRLHSNVRDSDICSRLGGDEFVVILTQVDDPQHVSDKCQQLLQALAQPYSLQGHLLSVNASIGVSIFPRHGEHIDELLRHADSALSQAKSQGRNRCCMYDASSDDGQSKRANLEQDLRQAIQQQQLTLVYQPQFHVGESAPRRVEALLRWPHPVHGHITPNEFIPLAEATGLMADIGLWALENACLHFLHWRRNGLELEKLAVNVSAIQIDGHFARRIQQILQSLQFDPHWLELEVTESLMMSSTTEVARQIEVLQAMGVEFAIDDFGTGYSSLSKIKAMPVKALKIDQSFVAGINSDPNDYEIVRAIILMASSLNMLVIAEGVETADQAEALQRLGCEWMQGYFFSHPLDSDTLFNQYRR